MHTPSDKFLRYLQMALFGLAIFFMLHALAIPIKGLMELKTTRTQSREQVPLQPVPVADEKEQPIIQATVLRI